MKSLGTKSVLYGGENYVLHFSLKVLLLYDLLFRKNRETFVSKCFEGEQLLVDLVDVETLRLSTAVYSSPHAHMSTTGYPSHTCLFAIASFEYFFAPPA